MVSKGERKEADAIFWDPYYIICLHTSIWIRINHSYFCWGKRSHTLIHSNGTGFPSFPRFGDSNSGAGLHGNHQQLATFELYCYWVGSLDFNFWIPFMFPFNQQKVLNLLLGDLQHPREETNPVTPAGATPVPGYRSQIPRGRTSISTRKLPADEARFVW